jgi:predicted RNase H-like nuclease (RuvC/YqgF family)
MSLMHHPAEGTAYRYRKPWKRSGTELSTDLNLLADKVQQLIAENARVAQNQDDYDRNYNELVSRYEAAKKQYDKNCEAIQYRKARSRQIDSFIKELQRAGTHQGVR